MSAKQTFIMVGALAALVTTAAYALPSNAFEITYYSDSSKTVVVGERSYMCGSQVYSTGTATAYFDYLDHGQCDPLPPPGCDPDPDGGFICY